VRENVPTGAFSHKQECVGVGAAKTWRFTGNSQATNNPFTAHFTPIGKIGAIL
jgi:hypothetical protein